MSYRLLLIFRIILIFLKVWLIWRLVFWRWFELFQILLILGDILSWVPLSPDSAWSPILLKRLKSHVVYVPIWQLVFLIHYKFSLGFPNHLLIVLLLAHSSICVNPRVCKHVDGFAQIIDDGLLKCKQTSMIRQSFHRLVSESRLNCRVYEILFILGHRPVVFDVGNRHIVSCLLVGYRISHRIMNCNIFFRNLALERPLAVSCV